MSPAAGPSALGLLTIEYYTDPLCCWSWALEPHWQRLRAEFGGQLAWRYRLGGLLRDWGSYRDELNAISRPAQMGPLWLEAKHTTGAAIDAHLWLRDPPASSYPACLAVKCAELQSAQAGDVYLHAVRAAALRDSRNIARPEVLAAVADELAAQVPEVFDAAAFHQTMADQAGVAAFREDLQHARYHQIGRFPTLTIQRGAGPGVLIVGYRPYEVLVQALRQVAPELVAARLREEPVETPAAGLAGPPLRVRS